MREGKAPERIVNQPNLLFNFGYVISAALGFVIRLYAEALMNRPSPLLSRHIL